MSQQPSQRKAAPSRLRQPAASPPRKSAAWWLLVVGLPALLVLMSAALMVVFFLPRLASRAAGGSTFVNPMPLKTYQVSRPEGTTRFRVRASLDTYFNYQYGGCERTHYSVRLGEVGKVDSLSGYVPRDSALGKRLFEALEDGKPHVLVLDLEPRGPKGEKTQGDVVAIVGIAGGL